MLKMFVMYYVKGPYKELAGGWAFPLEQTGFMQVNPRQVLIVRKSPGGPGIHMHNASSVHVGVEVGGVHMESPGYNKSKINSDCKKISSGPKCLQALHKQ